MDLKALIFDLDDTIMPEYPSERETMFEACATVGDLYGVEPRELGMAVYAEAHRLFHELPTYPYFNRIGAASFEALWGDFSGDDPDLARFRTYMDVYRRDTWKGALAKYGIHDEGLARCIEADYIARRSARHLLFEGAEEVLDSLRDGHEFVMLTNGVPGVQWAKIRGGGMDRWFDKYIISGELGYGKPDPRIFQLALEMGGATADTALMVGNSLTRDVAGAQQAGIRAVWCNFDGSPDPEDVTPDYTITDIRQLPGIVNG